MEFVFVVPRGDLFPDSYPHGLVPFGEDCSLESFQQAVVEHGFFVERARAEVEPERTGPKLGRKDVAQMQPREMQGFETLELSGVTDAGLEPVRETLAAETCSVVSLSVAYCLEITDAGIIAPRPHRLPAFEDLYRLMDLALGVASGGKKQAVLNDDSHPVTALLLSRFRNGRVSAVPEASRAAIKGLVAFDVWDRTYRPPEVFDDWKSTGENHE